VDAGDESQGQSLSADPRNAGGQGEASAIALALELDDCTIILDDHKARRLADRLGLNVTGTLGVIIKAKRMGVIGSIRPLLDAIRNTDFRLSEGLEAEALREAGE
jgi:predicted nucleic acid-binding protein